MTDILAYVSCKIKMYIFEIAQVIGENVPIAFLYVLSISISFLLAHLSQRLICELIVYQCSGVRRRRRCCRCQPFSNIFSSETARLIKPKFYVMPPWEGGTNVYINGPGHMIKMADMPIYGKNL